MCDCYDMMCKCKKFYVPIHIADFAYPRGIVKQAYCPYCNYLGPKADKKSYETNEDGEFAVENFIFHSGVAKGDEAKEEVKIYSKRVNGFFAFVFDKKHPDHKGAEQFLKEDVGFNGNPNDVANMVPDCYRYQCIHIGKRKRRDKFLKRFISVDHCQKYRKDIWKIKKRLRYDCKYCEEKQRKGGESGNEEIKG